MELCVLIHLEIGREQAKSDNSLLPEIRTRLRLCCVAKAPQISAGSMFHDTEEHWSCVHLRNQFRKANNSAATNPH